jgi:hypothetical protein
MLNGTVHSFDGEREAASLLIPSSGYTDLYIPTFPVSITSGERKLTASPISRMGTSWGFAGGSLAERHPRGASAQRASL